MRRYSPTAFSTWPTQFCTLPAFFSASPETSKSGSFVAFPTSSLTFPFTSWSLPSVRSCVLGFMFLFCLFVISSKLCLRPITRAAITPLLFFQHLRAPAPAPQTASGNESLPSSALRLLLHPFQLSQPATQSHAQSGNSPSRGDGRQKCRRHADRNRIRDSRELSLLRKPGRQPP